VTRERSLTDCKVGPICRLVLENDCEINSAPLDVVDHNMRLYGCFVDRHENQGEVRLDYRGPAVHAACNGDSPRFRWRPKETCSMPPPLPLCPPHFSPRPLPAPFSVGASPSFLRVPFFVDSDHTSLSHSCMPRQVLLSDFFLCNCAEEFMEAARHFIFETYCRIHHKIDIGMLAEKMVGVSLFCV